MAAPEKDGCLSVRANLFCGRLKKPPGFVILYRYTPQFREGHWTKKYEKVE